MRPSSGAVTPAHARNLILGDHALLRTTLDELDALLDSARGASPAHAPRLRERASAFVELFLNHLDLEEALLLTPLRSLAGGPALARTLLREHAEQREQIGALLDRILDTTRPVSDFARELRDFGRLVRIDMEHEETTILRHDLMAES